MALLTLRVSVNKLVRVDQSGLTVGVSENLFLLQVTPRNSLITNIISFYYSASVFVVRCVITEQKSTIYKM